MMGTEVLHPLKSAAGPRVLVGALAMLAFAAPPANAQLLGLPSVDQLAPPDGPVGQLVEPVQEIVHAPLPSPLEEVVQDTPLAPVREEVREIVGSPGSGAPSVPSPTIPPPSGGRPGGSSPGGGAGGGDPPASAAVAGVGSAPAAPAPGGAIPRTESNPSGPSSGAGSAETRAGRDRAARRGSDGRPDRARGGASDGPADGAAPAAPARAERTASRRDVAADPKDDEGAIARTVERIVEVVPAVIWVALAALALLTLAFGTRALIDRRHARALRRERERLLRDMGLLERVLLPQVPDRLGNLAASVAYRPAAGPAAGGDFYDVFELPGGRVALVVGDVSGHGREALERTSSLRPMLRGHLEAGLSPREALEAAGRAAGFDENGGFTTAVVAVHDPAAGTLTYAAAGHPPPILVGPGAHEPLTVASAPPIGVGLRTGLRQTTVPLPRGSAACFVTDGLLEARAGDSLLGPEWLAGVIAGFGPLDSAAALLDRVVEHADETPDDMTACLVRAVAGGSAAGPRIEELDIEPGELDSAAPRRLLEACGLPEDAIADTLATAREVSEGTGKALLTVTIDGGAPSVRVTAPTREALTTS
jgi:serine phosphatase RsbU (regulator of sigma subunit)